MIFDSQLIIYFILKDRRDRSGIRMYATKKLRPIEFDIIGIGAASSWNGILMPPGVDEFVTEFVCPASCIDVINFDYFLHSKLSLISFVLGF